MQRRNILKSFLHAMVLGLLCTPSLRAQFDINAIEQIAGFTFNELYDEAVRWNRPFLVVCVETRVGEALHSDYLLKQSILGALQRTPNISPLNRQPIAKMTVYKVKHENGRFTLEPVTDAEVGAVRIAIASAASSPAPVPVAPTLMQSGGPGNRGTSASSAPFRERAERLSRCDELGQVVAYPLGLFTMLYIFVSISRGAAEQ